MSPPSHSVTSPATHMKEDNRIHTGWVLPWIMKETQGGGWRWGGGLNLICPMLTTAVWLRPHISPASMCVCVLYNSVIKLPLGSDCGRWASYLWVRCVRWKALAADLHLPHHSPPTDGCLTTKTERSCLWFMKCFLYFPHYEFSFLINVYIYITIYLSIVF